VSDTHFPEGYDDDVDGETVERWERDDRKRDRRGNADPRMDIPDAESEHEFNGNGHDGAGAHTKTDAGEPLNWLDISSWDNEPVPQRQWAIRDRVPLNQAGLLSGEGGTGKSIIELTKDVAHVAGKDWFGSLPEPGPAFYLGAEDDKTEIHIRLAAIAKHYGLTFKDLVDGGLHILGLLGQDAVLCAATGKSGRVETTKLYRRSSRRQVARGDCAPGSRKTRIM
jgi:AAA domain